MTFDRTWTAYEARCEAQRLAFAPVAFQCVLLARRRGLLEALEGHPGCTAAEAAAHCGLPEAGARLLLENCLPVGVVQQEGGGWRLGTVGHYVLHDRMTRVNFDFIQDVCWEGLKDLETSLDEGRPAGLRHLGPWESIYPALPELPEPARTSWFAFDHHYSDGVFQRVLPQILGHGPRRILELGANTGKGALRCLELDPSVQLTLVDLPAQVATLEQVLAGPIAEGRVRCLALDLRDPAVTLPPGQDAIWMSQFLCCFSQEEVRRILVRAREALAPGGRVHVVDTFWDRQRYDVAAASLIHTSPYFTCMANGVGRMLAGADLLQWATEAGLVLESAVDGLGQAHSLVTWRGSEL
jgi:hypothetical protein